MKQQLNYDTNQEDGHRPECKTEVPGIHNILKPQLLKDQGLLIHDLKYDKGDVQFQFYTYEDTINNTVNRNLLTYSDCYCVQNRGFTNLHDVEHAEQEPLIADIESKLGNVVAIDFETTGLSSDSKVKGIGISDGNTHAYLDTDSIDDTILHLFLTYLMENHTLVAHNAKYEYALALSNFNIEMHTIQDTMVMGYVLLGRTYRDLSLSTLANQFLNRFPKGWHELLGDDYCKEHSNIDVLYRSEDRFKELASYCCEDCYETTLLYHYFRDRLKDESLWQIYEIDNESSIVAARMEATGIGVDREKAQELTEQLESELAVIQDEVVISVGYFPNPRSPKQMNKFYFDDLGLPTEGLEKTNVGFKVNDKARKRLAQNSPTVQYFDDYTRVSKLLSTYLNPLPDYIGSDNRLHAKFNCIHTVTGRLSSSNPNLQNIPNASKYDSLENSYIAKLGKKVRELFVPREGYVFIACDYSSFEFRILAHLSQDPMLLDIYREGEDLHSIMTMKLFKYSSFNRNNPEHESARTITKTLNYGMAYGMTAHRLYNEQHEKGLGYSFEECQGIVEEYWRLLPKLKEYFAYVKLKVIAEGFTETVWGRKRYFDFDNPGLKSLRGLDIPYTPQKLESLESLNYFNNPSDAKKLREAQNAPIQGTNADVIRKAMGDAYRSLETEDECYLLLQVHDELVFEVRKDVALQYSKQIQRTMESCIDLDVPIVAEPKFGTNWGECK